MSAQAENNEERLQHYLNHKLPLTIEFVQGKLTLNKEGFTTQRMFSTWTYQWKNVSKFIVKKMHPLSYANPTSLGILPIPGLTPCNPYTVYFNNNSNALRDIIIKFLTGYTDRLPFQLFNTNTALPLAADQVAQLMNQFRAKALGESD